MKACINTNDLPGLRVGKSKETSYSYLLNGLDIQSILVILINAFLYLVTFFVKFCSLIFAL